MAIQQKSQDDAGSIRIAIRAAMLILLALLSVLFLVYRTFPQVTEEERQHLKIPWNIEEAKRLGIVLNRYKDDHYFQVMAGVYATYTFLQMFGLPGCSPLSFLSGYLFPVGVALFLSCSCSALASSLCFFFSHAWGRQLLLKHYPEKVRALNHRLDKHRDNMFSYVLFLRIAPMVPAPLVNFMAPVLGVPLVSLASATFLAMAPISFVAVQGGRTLQSVASEEFAIGATSLAGLAVCAAVTLTLIVLKSWLKKKIE